VLLEGKPQSASRSRVTPSLDFLIETPTLGAYSPAMTFGSSLVLIAVGAILRYAVTATVSGIDLQVVGLVLMIVGLVGLAISLLWFGVWAGRRQEVPPLEREVRDRNIY
jgi:hypothetical protein